MNKVEVLKAQKDGLDIKESIARYAELGWEAISEEDIQRLKWYGVFLRNPTPGFFMVRVRIPGGTNHNGANSYVSASSQNLWERVAGSDHQATVSAPSIKNCTCSGSFSPIGRSWADLVANRHGQCTKYYDLSCGRVDGSRKIRCDGFGCTPHARVYRQ